MELDKWEQPDVEHIFSDLQYKCEECEDEKPF